MKWWVTPNSDSYKTRTLFKCRWLIQQPAQINYPNVETSQGNNFRLNRGVLQEPMLRVPFSWRNLADRDNQNCGSLMTTMFVTIFFCVVVIVAADNGTSVLAAKKNMATMVRTLIITAPIATARKRRKASLSIQEKKHRSGDYSPSLIFWPHSSLSLTPLLSSHLSPNFLTLI